LVKSEQKMIAKICKACGAGGDENEDNVCDMPASGFSPANIGFEPDCLDVTVPGSGMSCAGTVTTLGDLIACVNCLTQFEAACTAHLGAASETSYPSECSAVP
jgi:hypothetical protein